ncbi:MAG: hypothetical protein AAF517_15925 [Planctomycetota bacterium]
MRRRFVCVRRDLIPRLDTVSMTYICPNCSEASASEPDECSRCGYRGSLAREYFWLYIGGATFIVFGFAYGLLSLSVHDAPEDHWSAPFRSWYPLGGWILTYHWLAFLSEGIVFTLSGMGITRHRWLGWWSALAAVVFDLAFSAYAYASNHAEVSTAVFASVAAFHGLLCLSLIRLGIALRRTPPRNIHRLQSPESSRESGQSATS